MERTKLLRSSVLLVSTGTLVYFALTAGNIKYPSIRYPERNSSTLSSHQECDVCQPKSRLMFLKTHKTASTSIRTAIERYSEDHNLTIALSSANYKNEFRWPKPFQTDFVLPLLPGEKHYNTIFLHMRYNGSELKKIFPPNKTLYVTVIREPARHFESAFSYFYWRFPIFHKHAESFNHRSISQWLDDAEKYYKSDPHPLGKNGIFHDLGFDPKNESQAYIESAIKQLEDDFDLVLVSDYYPESMALLKDHMCWNLTDVVSVRENSRLPNSSDITQPISDELRAKIRAWNKADAALFDHFNETFWRKINTFGRNKMRKEVDILTELNKNLTKTCAEREEGKLKPKHKGEITKTEDELKVFFYDWKKTAKNEKICKLFMTPPIARCNQRNKKYWLKKEELSKLAKLNKIDKP